MRVDGSPLTVAFEDPVLQAEGLKSDRLGDAMRFFGLSHWEAHHIVCYCHYGRDMATETVARTVRAIAAQSKERRLSIRRSVGRAVAGGLSVAAGAALAIAVL